MIKVILVSTFAGKTISNGEVKKIEIRIEKLINENKMPILNINPDVLIFQKKRYAVAERTYDIESNDITFYLEEIP